MLNIGNYLQGFDRVTQNGTCKVCQKKVRWSRDRLASHKRANCSGISAAEKGLFFKLSNNTKNDSDDDKVSNPFSAETDENPAQTGIMFKISDYLRDFKKQTGQGTCKACEKSVKWSSKKLGSHKRATCAKATSEEKEFFHSQITPKESNIRVNQFSGVSDSGNTSNICKTRESVQQSANCFSCNSVLRSCRIPLNFTSEVSESPLAEILETTTGLEISEKAKSEEALCNRCYLLVEKFDDLKARSKVIEEKLVEMLQQKQTEYVYIKEEPEEYLEVDYSDNPDETDFNRNSEESDDDDDEWFSEAIAKRPKIEKKSSSEVEDLSEMSKNKYCEECSKNFKTEFCLRAHLATDHDRNEVDIECPTCFKTFQNQRFFKEHFRQHDKPRSILCGQCGATFSRKHSFKLHMMIHDDIRPFKCTFPDCSSRFLNAAKLKRHLRVHTGEKIYECPHCPGKRFAQKRGMDLHIENYHSSDVVKREVCKICGTRIPTSKMKLHLSQTHDVILEKAESRN